MKRSLLITAIITVLLVSFGSSIYGGNITGVTEKTVKIGSDIDLTGPSGVQGIGCNIGIESYFNYVNDSGGIHGRKIEYVVEDNGYQPAKAVAAMKKLLYRDKVFAPFTWGTVCILAVANEVKKENVPIIGIAASDAYHKPFRPHIFSFLVSQQRQAIAVADYIFNTMKPKDLRLGCLYQDDEYGRSGVRGLKAAAKRYGIELVETAGFKRDAVNHTSQIIQVKRAGANYVYIGTVIRHASGILKEANKLGWHPQFFGNHGSSDRKVIELAGEAARGYMGCRYITDLDDTASGVSKVRDMILKYHKSLKRTGGLTIAGWVGAMLMSEGLKRSGRDLTRDGLMDAFETMKSFDPDGLMPPLTWGPKRREGGRGVRIAKADLEKKVFVPVTDWIVPAD